MSAPIADVVDVLIVGSGPAGAMYARTIGEAVPDARILMVEVGPAIPGIRGNHTANMTETDRGAAQLLTQGPDAGIKQSMSLSDFASGLGSGPDSKQGVFPGLFLVDPPSKLTDGDVGLSAAAMASGVGGMGIHWATICPRPHQSERIPFIPAEETDAALSHAERVLDVTTPHGDDGLLGALRRAIAEEFDGPGLTPAQFLPMASRWNGRRPRYSGTGVILGDLERAVPGFQLRSDTLARRVIVEDGAAVGAELEDRRTGERYAVRASNVVLCADGLRTPQLLFASGIRVPALGHYLNDHYQMATMVTLSDEFDTARRSTEANSVGSVVVPFSDARPMQGGVAPLAGIPFDVPGLDESSAGRHAVLSWYGAKDIQYRDAVQFSDTETDFYGMPRMTIHYSRTAKDLTTIELMRQSSLRAADRVGTPIEPPQLAAGGSSLHYQGTVRMGATDDGTSVCDPYLRVWDVENLFVGGNGVIPTATAANPTLTNVALAWRAATRLASQLTSERRRDVVAR
jgi:choline dehydrogenase-like flavoprotein